MLTLITSEIKTAVCLVLNRNFGNKIIQIKPLVKFLSKLMEDRDKNVRDGTKQLIVEMYRWIGAAIKPKLVDLKPVLVCL